MTSLRCGNPTCAATLTVPNRIPVAAALHNNGWVIQQQSGDDCERCYCRRCRE